MTWRTVRGVLGAALFVFTAGVLFAAEEASEVVRKSWLDLFQATGIVGILLLGTSIVGTALLIQFLVNINPEKLGNAGLLAEVDSLLSEGQVDEALSIAQSDTTYAGKIMAGALSRSYGGTEEIKKGMEEATTTESFRLNAKISYLSLVGNIGPLLGLLGTVTGMISSFQVIESMKAPTPGDLAKGVYESLVNTTMGLFIAIIFLSAYFFMKNRLSEIMLNINSQISEILSHGVFTEPQKAGGR
jgi:biopolymer transport protein ExbB